MASLKEYRFLALMALFIVSVFLPGIAVAQGGTGVIYGTVTGQGGDVIEDCKVTIEGTEHRGLHGSRRRLQLGSGARSANTPSYSITSGSRRDPRR